MVESSIARNHEIAIAFVNPCEKETPNFFKEQIKKWKMGKTLELGAYFLVEEKLCKEEKKMKTEEALENQNGNNEKAK